MYMSTIFVIACFKSINLIQYWIKKAKLVRSVTFKLLIFRYQTIVNYFYFLSFDHFSGLLFLFFWPLLLSNWGLVKWKCLCIILLLLNKSSGQQFCFWIQVSIEFKIWIRSAWYSAECTEWSSGQINWLYVHLKRIK